MIQINKSRISSALIILFFLCLILGDAKYAMASTDPWGYICKSETIDCGQTSAIFSVYKANDDTYFACSPDFPSCSEFNSIYLSSREHTGFFVCKGGISGCGVINGLYYVDINDTKSFYACKDRIPVCNSGNGDYFIEKDNDSSTYYICEGIMPICNIINAEYVFQRVMESNPPQSSINTDDTEPVTPLVTIPVVKIPTPISSFSSAEPSQIPETITQEAATASMDNFIATTTVTLKTNEEPPKKSFWQRFFDWFKFW